MPKSTTTIMFEWMQNQSSDTREREREYDVETSNAPADLKLS